MSTHPHLSIKEVKHYAPKDSASPALDLRMCLEEEFASTWFLPTRGRILVRLMDGARISETIIAPERYKMKFGMGEVMAIGPNKRDDEGNERPSQLQIGDVVYFGQWKDIEREGLAFIHEDDVILKRAHESIFGSIESALLIPHTSRYEEGSLAGDYWVPIHGRIIVKPDTSPHTIGRLRAPDQADRETVQGQVLACGTGTWREGMTYPLLCHPGDTILFWEHAKQEFTLNGERLFVMRDEDVLGKLQ